MIGSIKELCFLSQLSTPLALPALGLAAVSLVALAVAVLSELSSFHCIFWEELERSTLPSKI